MGEVERASELRGCDAFERLPDSLLLHLFTYLPGPQDQQRIAQTCRKFRDLAKQIPTLHIVSNSDSSSLLKAIDKIIGARERNTLRELFVIVDLTVVEDFALSRWISNCSSSLESLTVQDDIEEESRSTCLDLRLKNASVCPNLRSLTLSGSNNVSFRPPVLSKCRFRSLQELALERLAIHSTGALQDLVASCPKLEVLKLHEVGPLLDISIRSTSLRSFVITRSSHVDNMEVSEKFASVVLLTPELERAMITDVRYKIQIQSTKLESLTLQGTATCKVVCQEWSSLAALDIQADHFDASSPARWYMDDLLSLVSSVTPELESLRIVLWGKHSIKGAGPEKLRMFFQKIGSVKKAVFSTHFLDQNGLNQDADNFQEQKKLFEKGVFENLVEVRIFFDVEAQLSHGAYVHFFLQMCPKIARLVLDCTKAKGIKGDFIRLVMTYQQSHPSLDLDFEFPDTLQDPDAETDDESDSEEGSGAD